MWWWWGGERGFYLLSKLEGHVPAACVADQKVLRESTVQSDPLRTRQGLEGEQRPHIPRALHNHTAPGPDTSCPTNRVAIPQHCGAHTCMQSHSEGAP